MIIGDRKLYSYKSCIEKDYKGVVVFEIYLMRKSTEEYPEDLGGKEGVVYTTTMIEKKGIFK